MEDIDLRKYVMSANRCPNCDSPHNSQYKMKDVGLNWFFRYFNCRDCQIKWVQHSNFCITTSTSMYKRFRKRHDERQKTHRTPAKQKQNENTYKPCVDGSF